MDTWNYPHEAPRSHTADILFIHDAARTFSKRGDSQRIRFKDIGGAFPLQLSFNSFGEQDELADDPTSIDSFDKELYWLNNPQIFLLRDVYLHTQYGLIAVDNICLRESVLHFPFDHFPEFEAEGPKYTETACRLPLPDSPVELSAALSAHDGINENYYHWNIMFLGRINQQFLSNWRDEIHATPVLLFPQFADDVQREGATILANHHRLPYLTMTPSTSIKVRDLIYPVPLRSGGIRPHPIIRESFDLLRNYLYERSSNYPTKIYVSRRDTRNRVMINEAEIEAWLTRHGYHVVDLTGKSLRDQINLFAHATHVIGPHGAGMTNIVFSEPGTKVLELQMPSHLNWCYRRLAAAFGLKYGHIYGNLETDFTRHVNSRRYSVSILNLQQAIETVAFGS